MNLFIGVGRVCTDIELKSTPSGQSVANFKLAMNETYKDKQGVKQEKAEFLRCVVWGKQAENVAKFLSKGRECSVQGKVTTRSWEDKEGQTRYATEIVANSVDFLGGKPEAQSAPESSLDIPF